MRYQKISIETDDIDGEPGLSDRRHRSMVAHHVGQFLQKYA